jgi:hypothetical protein
MIRRELAKDPKLATESWDRFLPQFRKRHLKTSEKTAKKNLKAEAKAEARKAAGLDPETPKDAKPAKKIYTPFPPAQLPRKVDLQLESGEYFLKPHEKEARETQRRKQKVSHQSCAPWWSVLNPPPRSKQRRQPNAVRKEPKYLSLQQKMLLQVLKRNANESDLPLILGWKQR